MKSNILISYLKLSKAPLSFAVSFSALIGYFISKNIDFYSGLILFFGVFFLSASASAINQIQEYKTDFLMNRTKNRPIPSKQISIFSAIMFSIIILIFGFLLLLKLSLFSALLGLFNVVIYNFIYTPLKYKSQFSLIAGGLVGAIPPIIGWFVSKLNFSHEIIFFATFMFLWQIPHFWILLIKFKQDYNIGKIKAITDNIDNNKLKFIIIIWIFSTTIFTFAFPLFGIIKENFQIITLAVLNVILVITFTKILFDKNEINQFRFANFYSHLYLILIFLVIISDKI